MTAKILPFKTSPKLHKKKRKVHDVYTKLTKPQAEFYEMEVRHPLFVGGYGSGKTEVKIVCALRDFAMAPDQQIRIGLYEPTYDLIKLNTAPRLEEKFEELKVRYEHNKSDHIITVFKKKGSRRHAKVGDFIMRSMDNPARIVAYECFRSHVDELGVVHPNIVQSIWNKIIARTRQKVRVRGPDGKKHRLKNRISSYCTPDDGFGFTYQTWGREQKPSYRFVRAPTYSNPFLPQEYIDSLYETYPNALVDAYIEGHWTNLTTGTIHYSFDRETCNTQVVARPKEHLHIGMDFNIYQMAATIGVIRENDKGTKVLYEVDEFVDLRDTPDMIRAIKAKYRQKGNEHPITVYPDSTGKAGSSTNADGSDHTILRKENWILKFDPTNPAIKNRIASVNAAFEKGKVKVNVEKCPKLTDALEQQPYDKHGEPDKTLGFDHINEAHGYKVTWIHGITKPTVQIVSMRHM